MIYKYIWKEYQRLMGSKIYLEGVLMLINQYLWKFNANE